MLKRSFTIIELLVVLSIIILVLGISTPYFAKFAQKSKLEAAARDIATALRTARMYAITNRKTYFVRFNTDTEVYNIGYTEGANDILVGKVLKTPELVDIVDISNNTGNQIKINFRSLGTADGRSVHIMKTGETITDYNDPVQRKKCYTITTDINTGTVTIYKYGKNTPWPPEEL